MVINAKQQFICLLRQVDKRFPNISKKFFAYKTTFTEHVFWVVIRQAFPQKT